MIFVEVDRLIIEPERHLVIARYLTQQSEIAPEQGIVKLVLVIVVPQTERIVV